MTDVITARGLTKSYGKHKALDGLDLTVPQGSVLGLLGPNGAGKTTAVRILSTLLPADGGTATVAGVDVLKRPEEVRKLIGLSGQSAAVDEYLTGYENLDMVGRLYHLGRKASSARARELLEQFSLVESGDRPAKTYSGGMRRRLDLAAALVARPPVLFLDEPTTGLDPRSRIEMWDTIRALVSDGATLLLTTQYLEEADKLADNIVVIDRGKAIAEGNADALKSQVGGERLELVIENSEDIDATKIALAQFAGGEVHIDPHTRQLTVPVTNGAQVLAKVLVELENKNISILDVGVRRPTLDDVFMTLTGHAAEDDEKKEEAK